MNLTDWYKICLAIDYDHKQRKVPTLAENISNSQPNLENYMLLWVSNVPFYNKIKNKIKFVF